VELGHLLHGLRHGIRVSDNLRWVEVSKAFFELQRCEPRPLRGHALVEDDGAKEGKWVRPKQLVRLGVGSELQDRSTFCGMVPSAELQQCHDDRLLLVTGTPFEGSCRKRA
jgi:hypothetical protein